MQQNLNVDAQEVAKFAALSDRWWDTQGEFKTLHDINPVRLNFIKEYCDLSGKKILDVGCGGGILSESMAMCGAEVSGIDMAESVLNAARLHLSQNKLMIDYRCITVEELAQEQPGHYDIVTCMELLEHVPNPVSIVAACAKLIKPQGSVFFSTLNRTPKAYLFAILGAEYMFKLLPKGTHDYAKFIRPSELSRWIEANELELQQLTGFSYNPLTRESKLCEDVAVNYLAFCRKEHSDHEKYQLKQYYLIWMVLYSILHLILPMH